MADYDKKIATGAAIEQAALEIKNQLMGVNGSTILAKWLPGYMDDLLEFANIEDSSKNYEFGEGTLEGTLVFEIIYNTEMTQFIAKDAEGIVYYEWGESDYLPSSETYGVTPTSGKLYHCTGNDRIYRWSGTSLVAVGGEDIDLSDIEHSIENIQAEVDAVERQATTNMQNINTLNTNTSNLNTRTTSAENKITKLMEKNFPTTASCSISPTNLQEQGFTAQVTINNFSLTSGGETLTIDKITINGSTIEGTAYTDSITNTTTYDIILFSGSISKKVTKTVTFVYPIYTGFSSQTTASAAVISDLTKESLRQSIGTLTVTHTNPSPTNYFWIVSPYKVTKVLTSNIEITKDFEKEVQIGSHYYYRLGKASIADTFTFIIS